MGSCGDDVAGSASSGWQQDVPGWPGPVVPIADVAHGQLGGPVHPTFSDPAIQEQFDRDGFVVVDFVPRRVMWEINELQRAVGASPGDPRTGFFQGHAGSSRAWKQTVADGVRPLVTPAVADLFDRHHVFYNTFLTKWPGADGALPAHQDPTMVADEWRYRGVTLWCPLDVTTDPAGHDRGGLWMVPGSHRLHTSSWYRARWYTESSFEGLQEPIMERFAVRVSLAPGQAVVFDHRTVHYSMANESADPRVVLALGLRPEATGNVNIESGPDGWITCHLVDDDYYLEIPAEGSLTSAPMWRVPRQRPPVVTLDDIRVEFERSRPPAARRTLRLRFARR